MFLNRHDGGGAHAITADSGVVSGNGHPLVTWFARRGHIEASKGNDTYDHDHRNDDDEHATAGAGVRRSCGGGRDGPRRRGDRKCGGGNPCLLEALLETCGESLSPSGVEVGREPRLCASSEAGIGTSGIDGESNSELCAAGRKPLCAHLPALTWQVYLVNEN